MGQELLTTFENEIGELALIPSDVGVFKVTADAGRLKEFSNLFYSSFFKLWFGIVKKKKVSQN